MVVVLNELDVGEIADGISGSGFAFALCCVVGRGWGVAAIDVYDVGRGLDVADYVAGDGGWYIWSAPF